MNFDELLNFIDLFKLSPYFLIKGEKELSTKVSKCLTVLTLVLLIILSINEFEKIYNRENYQLVDLKLDQSIGDQMKITKQDFMIGIKFLDPSLQQNFNKYFDLDISKLKFNYLDGTKQMDKLQLVPCTSEHFPNIYFSQIQMQDTLCLPIDFQYKIFRDMISDNALSIALTYCNVNTNNQCIDLTIAQNRIDFKNIYGQDQTIQIFVTQQKINPLDLRQPIQKFIQSLPFKISIDQLFYSDQLYQFEKNELIQQYSYLSYFQNLISIINFNSVDILNFSQLLQRRDPDQRNNLILSLNFVYGLKIRKIKVKFDNIMDALVRIYTTISLIIVAFGYISLHYNEQFYQLKLAEKIFQRNITPKSKFGLLNVEKILTVEQYRYLKKHMDIGNLIDTNIFSEQIQEYFFSKKYLHLFEIFRFPKDDLNDLKNYILRNEQYQQLTFKGRQINLYFDQFQIIFNMSRNFQIQEINFIQRYQKRNALKHPTNINSDNHLNKLFQLSNNQPINDFKQKIEMKQDNSELLKESEIELIVSNEKIPIQIQQTYFSNSFKCNVQEEKIKKPQLQQGQENKLIYKEETIKENIISQNQVQTTEKIDIINKKSEELDEFLAGFEEKDMNNPHKYFFDQILYVELKKLLQEKYNYQ